MRKQVQKYQNIFFSKCFFREHFQKIRLLDNICLLGHLASFYLSTLGISLGQFSDKGKLGIGGYFFVIFAFWRRPYFVPLFSIVKHSRYLWVKNCTDVSRSWHILTRYLKGKECVRSKKSFQIRCLTWSPHSLLAKSSEKMNIFSCCWFCCFFLVESRTFHFKKYLFGSITKWEEVKFLEINHLLVWSLLHNQKPKLFQRWSLKWNIINDTTLSSDPIFRSARTS